jgi:RNA polymerase sigma factor (sigma-70 family)
LPAGRNTIVSTRREGRGRAESVTTLQSPDHFSKAVDRLCQAQEGKSLIPLKDAELQLIRAHLAGVVKAHHANLPASELLDIVDEAIVKLLRALRQGRVERPAVGYVTEIAKNEATSRQRTKDAILDQPEEGSDDEDLQRLLEASAARLDVDAAFRAARRCGDARTVRVISAWLDLAGSKHRAPTLREVAQKVGVSHTTVKNILRNSRKYFPGAREEP